MVTLSSILAQKIPWTEEPGGLQSMELELQKSQTRFGEDNGTPLQYSCLEDPMDGGAWKAAVHGVAEGRT